MKALRAVVLAQNQRIELLERQLARIPNDEQEQESLDSYWSLDRSLTILHCNHMLCEWENAVEK